MANNIQIKTGTGTLATVATKDVNGVHFQQTIQEPHRGVTPTSANVTPTGASQVIFAANANAKHRFLFNDSAEELRMHRGGGAASATSPIAVPPGGTWSDSPVSDGGGEIRGKWPTANGGAGRTEEVA